MAIKLIFMGLKLPSFCAYMVITTSTQQPCQQQHQQKQDNEKILSAAAAQTHAHDYYESIDRSVSIEKVPTTAQSTLSIVHFMDSIFYH